MSGVVLIPVLKARSEPTAPIAMSVENLALTNLLTVSLARTTDSNPPSFAPRSNETVPRTGLHEIQ